MSTPQERVTARTREISKLIMFDATERELAAAEHRRRLSADGVTLGPEPHGPQPIEDSYELRAAAAYDRIIKKAQAEDRIEYLLPRALDMIAEAIGLDKYRELAENVRALSFADDDEVIDMTIDRIVGGGK